MLSWFQGPWLGSQQGDSVVVDFWMACKRHDHLPWRILWSWWSEGQLRGQGTSKNGNVWTHQLPLKMYSSFLFVCWTILTSSKRYISRRETHLLCCFPPVTVTLVTWISRYSYISLRITKSKWFVIIVSINMAIWRCASIFGPNMLIHFGGFLKMGAPLNHPLKNRIFRYKPTILGIPTPK